MLFGPVASLDSDECAEHRLEIRGNKVLWLFSDSIFRTFTLDEPVSHALLTFFNNEQSVVILCNDMVYTYSKHGKMVVMGLQFTPERVLSCENGVVFQYRQKLYIMRDPMSLIGTIALSSTSAISAADKLCFFGQKDVNVAIMQNGSTVKLFHIRDIKNKSRPLRTVKRQFSLPGTSGVALPMRKRQSSVHHERIISEDTSTMDKLQMPNDILLPKEAVISQFHSIEFEGDPDLEIVAQSFQNKQALYLWDKKSKVCKILVRATDNKVLLFSESRKIEGIAKLQGFKIADNWYPFVVLAESNLVLYSAFFNCVPLRLPTLPEWNTRFLQSSAKNCFNVDGNRLFLVTDINGRLVSRCFEVLANLLDHKSLVHWIMIYEAVYYLVPDQKDWLVFSLTVVACLCDFEGDVPGLLKISQTVQHAYPRLRMDHICSTLIVCLHMLREECSLDAHGDEDVENLGSLLAFLTLHAGWKDWTNYYNCEVQELQVSLVASKICQTVPNIFLTLTSLINPPYIEYPEIKSLKSIFYRTVVCQQLFAALGQSNLTADAMIELLDSLRLTLEKLDGFVEGVRIPIIEITGVLQQLKTLDSTGNESQFKLLNRRDLEATAFADADIDPPPSQHAPTQIRDMKSIIRQVETSELWEQPNENDRLNITRHIFSTDRRFHEICKLLETSKRPVCSLPQNDLSDHDYLGLQRNLAISIAMRTLATAFGRAAVFYSEKRPLISEKIALPNLEFNVVLKESQVTVSFQIAWVPSDILIWGYVHQGISVGLNISRNAQNINGSWIIYNKPESETVSLLHAGFLLGLGINGHLKNLEEWHIFSYMGQKDTVISMAILIGLSACELGSGNAKLTKVLSVHVPALLPAGSNDLKVHSDIQTAAILGIGLVYLETQHRRMTEVLWSQLYSEEDHSEFFRFASGLSLGLTNLCRGPKLGALVDFEIIEKLERLVTTVKDDIRNFPQISASQAGATTALMLMFLQSNKAEVAEKLSLPRSQAQAAYYRPDLLFTRSFAYHLVMWDDIGDTQEWIENAVPAELRGVYTLESANLPFFNILVSAVCAMCLKHTATNNERILSIVLRYIDKFRYLSDLEVTENTSSNVIMTLANINYIQASLVIAASLVVVGSGNLSLLQRLRILYGRVHGIQHVPSSVYCLQAGVSQAMGILFLGGGQYSLDTSRRSIAFLAISCGMLTCAGADMVKWQILRFFWAFAARPSALVIRDVDTKELLEVEAHVKSELGTQLVRTPCSIPLDTKSIEVINPQYLSIGIDITESSQVSKLFERTRTIYLQKQPYSTKDLSLVDFLDKKGAKMHSAVQILEYMSQNPARQSSYMWNLKLLFTFTDFWSSIERLSYLPSHEVDRFKLNVWRAVERERKIDEAQAE